jgi:hypothetical protein
MRLKLDNRNMKNQPSRPRCSRGGAGATNLSHCSPTSLVLPPRRRLSGPSDVRAARAEGGGVAFLLLSRQI